MLLIAEGYKESPRAKIFYGRILQSTLELGGGANYDGAEHQKGSKVQLVADTLGHLLALCVTAADEQDQAKISELARRAQAETSETVEIAYVDQRRD